MLTIVFYLIFYKNTKPNITESDAKLNLYAIFHVGMPNAHSNVSPFSKNFRQTASDKSDSKNSNSIFNEIKIRKTITTFKGKIYANYIDIFSTVTFCEHEY